jgi:hypothetical protein
MSVCRHPLFLIMLAVTVGVLGGCPCRVDTRESIRRELESRAPAGNTSRVTVAYTLDPPDTTVAEPEGTPPPETRVAEPGESPPPKYMEQPRAPLGDVPVPLLSEADQMALVADIQALREGLDELRRKVAFLEHNAQVVTTGTVARLTEENRQLRRELQRLYTGGGMAGGVPDARAGGFLAGPDTSDRDVADLSEPHPPLPPVMAVAGNPPGGLPYAVVKEWGVSPGEAAGNPGAVSSKGMVCAVPPSATEEDLRLLASRLRDEHGMYDRYTIDVFDDPEAARRYVEENALPGARRVLSVVKDPATGRDGAVLFRNGEEIGLTGE